jgi:saposin
MMNRLILLTALLVPVCLAGIDPHKEAMIKDNRTPKEAAPQFNSACDECKVLVARFDEAMKDPAKLEELKNLLNLLCDSTSYARECKLIVSRLDVIIKELAPYLQDPTAVCTKLHMCGNARLQKIHRLGLVYAKKYLNRVDGIHDVMCEECQFAVAELKALVEERGTQTEVQEYVREYVCKHLGQYQGMCDELVEQFLPELFQELEQFLQNSKQVCTDLGLCTGQNVLVNGQPLHPADNTNARSVPKTYRLKSFMTMLGNLQTQKGFSAECLECEALVATLLGLLESDSVRKGVAADLQKLACDEILPVDFKDGCDDFLGLYLETVLSLTLHEFTAGQICTMVHLCDSSKSRAIGRLTATERASEVCESCKSITDFVRSELGDAGFADEIEYGLKKYFCANLPQSVQNLCENVIQTYTPVVLRKVARMLNSETICKDDLHMCTDLQH